MSKTYTQEEYDIAVSAAYDKGRWGNPPMYKTFEELYYKQQKLDQSIKEAELDMMTMHIDKIDALTKERDEIKDKYITLMEHLNGFNKATAECY